MCFVNILLKVGRGESLLQNVDVVPARTGCPETWPQYHRSANCYSSMSLQSHCIAAAMDRPPDELRKQTCFSLRFIKTQNFFDLNSLFCVAGFNNFAISPKKKKNSCAEMDEDQITFVVSFSGCTKFSDKRSHISFTGFKRISASRFRVHREQSCKLAWI